MKEEIKSSKFSYENQQQTFHFFLCDKIRRLTSTGTKTTLSPNSAATSAPLDVGRSPRITLDPARAKRSTVARPKPDAPPVTNATALFYHNRK